VPYFLKGTRKNTGRGVHRAAQLGHRSGFGPRQKMGSSTHERTMKPNGNLGLQHHNGALKQGKSLEQCGKLKRVLARIGYRPEGSTPMKREERRSRLDKKKTSAGEKLRGGGTRVMQIRALGQKTNSCGYGRKGFEQEKIKKKKKVVADHLWQGGGTCQANRTLIMGGPQRDKRQGLRRKKMRARDDKKRTG